MATRSDVLVDFIPSPRIASVKAPATTLSLQDIVDTLRKREDSFRGQSEKKLLDAAGKEELGGGVQVGITSSLQDTQVAFEGRTSPAQIGTITTASGPPVNNLLDLIDAAAAFQTNSVARGSLVINFTDQSIAEVYSVESQTRLRTRVLVNGTDNQFDLNDDYQVFNVVQCEISGGNLVATDDNDLDLNPVLPTAFTQVIRTLSSSATLITTGGAIPSAQENALATWEYDLPNGAPASNSAARHIVEGGMQGAVWLDSLNGLDAQKGTTSLPIRTFTRAKEVLTNYQLKRIRVVSMMSEVLQVDLDNYEIIADNNLGDAILDLNGKSVAGTQFTSIGLTGDILLGSPEPAGISCVASTLYGPMTNLGGTFTACGFVCLAGEEFQLRTMQSTFFNCYASTVNNGMMVTPRFNVSSQAIGSPLGSPPVIGSPPLGEPIEVSFRNWNGSIEIAGLDNINSKVEIEANSGTITLTESCIAGTIVIRGNCELIDNSTKAVPISITIIDERAGNGELNQKAADTIWATNPASSAPPLGSAARFQIEAGFQDGAVWLDAVDGLDTNEGTVSQPVRTFDAARLVLSDYGLKRLRVVALTDSTLPVSLDGIQVIADSNLRDFVLNLNGESISGGYFEGIGLTGSLGETPDDRLLHFPMNETTGTNVPDISGQGNNGTTQNMDDTNWVAGKLNNALSFNGINEWVDTGTTGNFDSTDEFSIEYWTKMTTPASAGITVSKASTGLFTITGWYIQQNANGSIRFTLRSGFFFQRVRITTDTADPGFISVADGNWHHVVCTYSGNSAATGMNIWVDGIKQIVTVDTDNLTGSILNGVNSNIGRRSDGTYYDGLLDEVLIYDTILPSIQIAQRYNDGAGTESVGLTPVINSSKATFHSPMTGLAGFFSDCGFTCDAGESFKVQAADVGSPIGSPVTGSSIPTSFINCYVASVEEGNPVPPRFDLSGVNIDVVFRGWSGSIEIIGLNDPSSRVEIETSSGVVTIASSCTAGTIVIRGACQFIDNSVGSPAIQIIDETTPFVVWEKDITSSAPPPNAARRHQVEGGMQNGSIWLDGVDGSDAQEGTVSLPIKTFTQARAVLLDYQMKRVRVVALEDTQLDVSFDNFEIIADNDLGDAKLNLNNQSVANTHFTGISLTGDILIGSPTSPGISCLGSILHSPMTNLGGTFRNCGFICQVGESFQLQQIQSRFINCYTANVETNGFIPPRFNASGTNVDAVFRKWSGSLEIIGLNDSSSRIEIESSSGTVTIAASNTAGTIVIRGTCDLIDNSVGSPTVTIIDERTSLQALQIDITNILNIVEEIRKYDKNRTRIDDVAFTLTVYDDDNVTPLKVFDLKDENGVASITRIFERFPLP